MTFETQAIFATLQSAAPWDVFSYATPVIKLTMLISLIAAGAALILAILRKTSSGRHSGLLSGLGMTGLLFGVLGAFYTGAISYVAAKSSHTTNLLVLLPSIIEVIYAFLFGLIAWLIAVWGNTGAKRA